MKITLTIPDEYFTNSPKVTIDKVSDTFDALILQSRTNGLVVSVSSFRDVEDRAMYVRIETAENYESDLVALQTIFPKLVLLQEFVSK